MPLKNERGGLGVRKNKSKYKPAIFQGEGGEDNNIKSKIWDGVTELEKWDRTWKIYNQ